LIEQNGTQIGSSESRFAESSRFLDPLGEPSLKELALVPWKRRVAVASCVASCVLAAILVCVFMHPKYRATATIELNQEKGSGAEMLSSLSSMGLDGPDDLKTRVDTETAIIKDDSIALAVMSKMGMLRLENPDRFSKEPGPVVRKRCPPRGGKRSFTGLRRIWM